MVLNCGTKQYCLYLYVSVYSRGSCSVYRISTFVACLVTHCPRLSCSFIVPVLCFFFGVCVFFSIVGNAQSLSAGPFTCTPPPFFRRIFWYCCSCILYLSCHFHFSPTIPLPYFHPPIHHYHSSFTPHSPFTITHHKITLTLYTFTLIYTLVHETYISVILVIFAYCPHRHIATP